MPSADGGVLHQVRSNLQAQRDRKLLHCATTLQVFENLLQYCPGHYMPKDNTEKQNLDRQVMHDIEHGNLPEEIRCQREIEVDGAIHKYHDETADLNKQIEDSECRMNILINILHWFNERFTDNICVCKADTEWRSLQLKGCVR
jgi:hypothetical protein